jgi:hypothetical protein
VSRFQRTCHLHLLHWRQMQQFPMNIGSICRTTRPHNPEVATFSNIPKALNSMRFYMGRVCSAGTATNYGLHFSGIESRLRGCFPHSSRLDLVPIQPSGEREPVIFPEGKFSGTWRLSPPTCRVWVKERVEIYSCSLLRPSWPVLSVALCSLYF